MWHSIHTVLALESVQYWYLDSQNWEAAERPPHLYATTHAAAFLHWTCTACMACMDPGCLTDIGAKLSLQHEQIDFPVVVIGVHNNACMMLPSAIYPTHCCHGHFTSLVCLQQLVHVQADLTCTSPLPYTELPLPWAMLQCKMLHCTMHNASHIAV